MKSLRLSTRALLGVLLSILFVSGACLQPATPMPPTPTPCAPAPSLFDLPSEVYAVYVRGNSISAENAFRLLSSQVRRWSAFADVQHPLGLYRVTVTLISPDLYRAVLINQAVSMNLNGAAIAEALRQYDEGRKNAGQLRFLVTATYAQYAGMNIAPQTILLPAANMHMLDRNNQPVLPAKAEGVFGAPLNVAKGPFSGIVTYDLELASCQPRLRIDEDTSVTLRLEGARVGDAEQTYSLQWSMKLAPVLSVTRPTLMPVQTPSALPLPGAGSIMPRNQPPAPSTAASAPNEAYWNELARYVWGQLALAAGQ